MNRSQTCYEFSKILMKKFITSTIFKIFKIFFHHVIDPFISYNFSLSNIFVPWTICSRRFFLWISLFFGHHFWKIITSTFVGLAQNFFQIWKGHGIYFNISEFHPYPDFGCLQYVCRVGNIPVKQNRSMLRRYVRTTNWKNKSFDISHVSKTFASYNIHLKL